MSSNQEFSLNNQIDNSISSDEIDLKKTFLALTRNRKLIVAFSSIGLLISFITILSTKRVWQGEFQIVLDFENNEQQINPILANLANFNQNGKELKTEVGILKSPSVLMNIFEFVKTKKIQEDRKAYQLRFKDWKKELNVNLERDTSILNLSYRDTNKDLILPVLNRISNQYQKYSGKRRLRKLDLSLEYLNQQVQIFKAKSIESFRKSQEFAIKYDLGESEIVNYAQKFINIEGIRVAAANEIRFVDQELKAIENSKYDAEIALFIASTVPSMQNLLSRLESLDIKLISAKTIYKENDPIIKNINKEKIILTSILKRKAKGYLIAKKSSAQARMKSSERPQEVIIKYSQLLTAATKDKETLNKLEDQYRIVSLEKARSEDPWELITKPTLLPSPVAPNRKRIIIFGLIGGFLSGIVASFISDVRKNTIFSLDEIKLLTQWPVLVELPINQQQSWGEFFHLIASGDISDNDGEIALVPVGNIDKSLLLLISQNLGNLLRNSNLKISSDLREVSNCSILIVISALGKTRKQEIIEMNKKLILQNKSLIYSLVIGSNDKN